MKIRIKFAKYGCMKFIGHLDVMRFFQKAIRRANIDIKYSEGFSPHQIMSFAAPLGVGIESTGEYLDIEVDTMTSTEEMMNALNKAMVEGMKILSVTVLPDTVKNAMASVAAAKYQVSFDRKWIDDISGKLSAFYAREHIMVTKTTKKSVMELDLKPGIYELWADECPEGKKKAFTITMLVDASSSGNIKPMMVIEAFAEYCQIDLPIDNCQITRIDTYTNLGTEDGERKLVPLGEVGKA